MEGGQKVWLGQVDKILSVERFVKEGVSRRIFKFNFKIGNLGLER